MAGRVESGSDRQIVKAADGQWEAAWKRFAALVQSRNQRMTQARRIVFEQTLARRDHFRAEDLVAELARGRRRVSQGTVYKTLALMVEAGIVLEVYDSRRCVRYEAATDRNHGHLICDACGRFLEFKAAEIESHIVGVCKARRFTRRAHRVVVFGTCQLCRSEGLSAPS